MGLTAGCAVCHNHKFDPLTQKEFYEMAAFFNNTTQGAMDGNVKDTPPIVPLPLREDRERWEALQGELAKADREIEANRQAARERFTGRSGASRGPSFASLVPSEKLRFRAALDGGAGREVEVVLDGNVRKVSFSGEPAWTGGQVGARALRTGKEAVLEIGDAGNFEKDSPFSFAAWVQVQTGDLT